MGQRMSPFCMTALVSFIVVGQALAAQFFEKEGAAIRGYDPVAYFTDKKPVKGSPELKSDYQGSIFYFVSAAHRDAFASNPEKFVPQYGGFCAFGMAKGYKASIDPAAFTIVGEKLYLNYSESVRTAWQQDIPGNIAKADKNWPEVAHHLTVRE